MTGMTSKVNTRTIEAMLVQPNTTADGRATAPLVHPMTAMIQSKSLCEVIDYGFLRSIIISL